MDRLRDGRLIYLFTAVSRQTEGLGTCGPRASTSPTRLPAAKLSLPCQGLSKLQELVRHHIYSHGQVRGFPPRVSPLAHDAGLLRGLSVGTGPPRGPCSSPCPPGLL